MASITDLKPPIPPDDARPYLGPAPVQRRRAAFAMLLTGRAREDDSAVDHFERFAQQQRLSTDGLWIATQGGPLGRMDASILMVPNPGATAMLFIGQAGAWRDHQVVVDLIRTACLNELYREVRVVQSLLDPGQVLEAKVLERAGLRKLAKLVYMQKGIDRREFAAPRPETLARVPAKLSLYTEANHGRFARAILASYEDTLDCPGLVGLRDIDQIILGHRSTGRFDPNLWHVFYDEQDRPIAVLLLAPSSAGVGFELVYLGVARPYRGMGVGGQLMSYAIAESTRRGADRMYLAVDDRNEPAMKLYHALGFRGVTRKLAYIMPRDAG
ncbi:MAG: GNAT family N-acetyltransferase [Planctomycetota bacterium]